MSRKKKYIYIIVAGQEEEVLLRNSAIDNDAAIVFSVSYCWPAATGCSD